MAAGDAERAREREQRGGSGTGPAPERERAGQDPRRGRGDQRVRMQSPQLDESRAHVDGDRRARARARRARESDQDEHPPGGEQQPRRLRVGHRAKRSEQPRCHFGRKEDRRLPVAEQRGARALRWIEEQVVARRSTPRDHLRDGIEQNRIDRARALGGARHQLGVGPGRYADEHAASAPGCAAFRNPDAV